MKRFSGLVLLLVVLEFLSHAEAALIDRGGGLIYDSVLNVTWLQDANYAKTSGYDADGRMTWDQANAWASNLSYGGYTDWRLPNILPISGGNVHNVAGSRDGSTDHGYNVSAPGSAYSGNTGSELAYMYYNSLRNISPYYPNGSSGQTAPFGFVNTGLFINLENHYYWSGTLLHEDLNYAWLFFSTGDFWGYQSYDWAHDYYFGLAWAVRDGDVAPVPLPSAIWLFGSGLAGIMGFIKLKRNRRA